MRPRISIRGYVRPSVGPSVRWSVRWSVRPLVRNAFAKIAENGEMQNGDASYVVYTALFNTQREVVATSPYSLLVESFSYFE